MQAVRTSGKARGRAIATTIALALAGVVGACSHGPAAAMLDAGGPDGHGSGSGSDGNGYAACGELATAAPQTLPLHVAGTLAGADLESPSACATVDAPFGIESAGPDSVIRLDGLTVGNRYVVKLTSTSDLLFYVVTGCATPTGPSSEQCQLFVDASKTSELGTFVATQTTEFVVVDYYAATPPADLTFQLDAYADACDDATACPTSNPICLDHRCVGCGSSFDCPDPALPVCDTFDHRCEVGVDQCTSDDLHEPANDGPAGAVPLVPGSPATGQICASPTTEADFYAFDVAGLGERWGFQLAWNGAADLDLELFDARGTLLGLSYWEQPEQAALTYLAPGRYYVRVSEYSASASTSAVTYHLTATRQTTGAGCTSRVDCATEYRNQIYRGDCVAGACVALDGNGATAAGGACDSQADCQTGLHCPSFYFVADAGTREVCGAECTNDTQCPDGDVCTTYLSPNFCVAKCTTDDQCATAIQTQPFSGPWARLSCETSTGRCLP